MENINIDINVLWICISAFLVFLMQAGFLCLESGFTRSKNAINVAFKNLVDFSIAVMLYWAFGFALMFGISFQGWFGQSYFLLPVQAETAGVVAFFVFEVMFCATATTILSGAVAERFQLKAYVFATAFTSGLIYPLFGHWAWGGALTATQGWLQVRGFVDFAGSSVVHSVGGWVSLAALLIIGARTGRFAQGRTVRQIHGSNLPLSMLGVCLLLFGWFGFNGGSTLALNHAVPAIIVNTLLGGVAGALTASAWGWYRYGYAEVGYLINGMLAGLVAITAGCHAITVSQAILIGGIGGLIFCFANQLLLYLKIDDAVGAVPTHLAAGIWGTLAVGFFGDLSILNTGLSRLEQINVQLLGILVCAVWAFGCAYFFLMTLNRIFPLRVSLEAEEQGLNLAEHGAKTDLVELLTIMQTHEKNGYIGNYVPVEPFTEVGQIARQYNRVMTALDKASMQLRAIIHDIRDGIITFNRQGVITSFSAGAEQLFGYSATSIIGHPVTVLWQQADPHFLSAAYEMTLPVGIKREIEVKRQDTTTLMVELTITQSWLQRDVMYTTLIRDITERKQMEAQLFAEKELAQTTLASIGDAVITTNATGSIAYLNPTAESLTGWIRADAVGQPIHEVYYLIDEVTRDVLLSPMHRAYQHNPNTHKPNHAVLIRRDGHEIALEDSVAPIRNQQGSVMGIVVVFHDVTKTRKLAQQLSYQAKHDALTGLVNRTEFEYRLQHLLENSEQERARHVLCYLDLDNFKVVNDTCGHVAGDELLRQITALFKTRVRGTDTLARLGGDEFGLLFQNCAVEQAENIAEQLRESVHRFRFVWNTYTFRIGVSIGLVEIKGCGETLASIQAAADTACYIAKDSGRNCIHIFRPSDLEGKEQPEPVQWLHRIEHALQTDRLRLLYQSICPLHTAEGTEGYYEIFVSLLDQHNRLIPPGAFIPAAERYNIMPLIDRWVIRNICAWVGDYLRGGKYPLKLCMVNLSATAVGDEDFLKLVAELIRKHQIPPHILCFEVVESVLIANIAKSAQFIHALHALGCYFSVDDFGRGLSSFSYFKELHVDFLKIDGAFVKDIAKEEIDYALVASINHIAHVMGFKTIAEFVESETVLNKLREVGVDFAQGYHVAEPKPLEQLAGVWMMPR
ncbi:ammonium transporter [Beggiatoa alba B18LD]|uniref:Ammonium transporter n=1 Tax=Beggiatoa alba B18LD TaxID=395493 RepID=I3CCQ1_9GAMM|nr:ammonium transporter [Beggiatoa alba]EIJ41394.1 ammonium transporter [Beggiatoa alba B18LD]